MRVQEKHVRGAPSASIACVSDWPFGVFLPSEAALGERAPCHRSGSGRPVSDARPALESDGGRWAATPFSGSAEGAARGSPGLWRGAGCPRAGLDPALWRGGFSLGGKGDSRPVACPGATHLHGLQRAARHNATMAAPHSTAKSMGTVTAGGENEAGVTLTAVRAADASPRTRQALPALPGPLGASR